MSDQLNITMFGTGESQGVLPKWARLMKCMPCQLDGEPQGWLYVYGPHVSLSPTSCLVYWTPPPGNYVIVSPWVAEGLSSPLLISSTLLYPQVEMFPEGKMKQLARWVKSKQGGNAVGQFNPVIFCEGLIDSKNQLFHPLPNHCPSLLFGPLGRSFKQRSLLRALRKHDIPESWLQSTIYEGHPRFRKHLG